VWLKDDRQLRNALRVTTPPVPLLSIHARARAGAVRERLQRTIFGLAIVAALTLSFHGIQRPGIQPYAVPMPVPAPAPSPTVT
jgi:hypothetical protein